MTDIFGIEFYDATTGLTMKYAYPEKENGGWGGWLFYKHPDGQWVSLRKATDDDLGRINAAVATAYHEEANHDD